MAKVKVIFVGSGILAAKLEGLTNAESKRAIGGACRESLKPMLAEAKRNAPAKSGKLRKSIRIKAIRSRKRIGARVTIGGGGSEYSGKQFYGAFQEFGWKTGSRKNKDPDNKNKKERRQVEPKHYLEKAASSNASGAVEIFNSVISVYIKKVIGRRK